MEEKEVRLLCLLLLLLACTFPAAGCRREGAGRASDLPGGDLLGALPEETLFGLSFPGRIPPDSPIPDLLVSLGFGREEIRFLERTDGLAAALAGRRLLALFRREGGGGSLPRRVRPWRGGILSFTPSGDSVPKGPVLADSPAWPVLTRAAAPWKGRLLLWISLARLLEGGGAGKGKEGMLPGRTAWLARREFREALNLDTFEALLARVERGGRGRAALFLWPDRFGLPGILLPGKGGIDGSPPRGAFSYLAWRIDPARLGSFLSGLESLSGPAGKMLQVGVGFLKARLGLDPARDLAAGLDGRILLAFGAEGGFLRAGLLSGERGRKVASALARPGLPLGALKALVGGKVSFLDGKGSICIRWGKPSFPLPELPRASREGSAIGLFRVRVTLPFLRREGSIVEGRVLRADYGMEVPFRLRN